MSKITPMQSLLLTRTAARDNGSLFPLPETMTQPPTVRRTIAAPIGRGWAQSRPTTDEAAMAHLEGNVRYGVFITPAGQVAVGIAPHEGGAATPLPIAHRTAKADKVIALVARRSIRPSGAAISPRRPALPASRGAALHPVPSH